MESFEQIKLHANFSKFEQKIFDRLKEEYYALLDGKTYEYYQEKKDLRRQGELNKKINQINDFYSDPQKRKEIIKANVARQIENAREILGDENVLGPDEVEETFNIHVDEVPPIPFFPEELERAKELGQFLIFRVDQTDEGKPLSLEAMNKLIAPKWAKEGKGSLLNTADSWKSWLGKSFSLESPHLGWALVGRDLLPDSTSKNYIEQTELIVKTLQDKAFKGLSLPPEYAEAIAEFESQKTKLTKLMNEDWKECAKQLSLLKITKLTRQTIAEGIYDLAMYNDINKKRLLENKYTWTSSLSPGGFLVGLGGFRVAGVSGFRWGPIDRGGGLGVSFSRSFSPDPLAFGL